MSAWVEKGGWVGVYLEVEALVLVRDKVGACKGDVVGEGGGVPVDVIAVAEHVLSHVLAAFLEGFHC